MQVVCDGAIIDYSQEGTGPVLLFMHGWMDSKATWRPLITELSREYRCIALDLPNFGASEKTDTIISVDQYARCVQIFVEKLGLHDYTLVGHSMGVQIALYGVGETILQPTRLIAIGGAGVREVQKKRKQILRVASKTVKVFVPASVKKRYYKVIGSDYDPGLSSTLKKVIDAMLTTDVQEATKNIKIPTLLIYGEKDTATPPAYGKILHGLIPGSQYHEIPHENHWLHQNSAAVIAKQIRKFLD